MWRALVFIGLLCVAAFAAVWLADRPGTVLVTFGGYELQTSVAVAAVALAGLALALAVLWSAVSALLRLPSRMSFASRARRRARGYQAVSRGMIAVGAGDSIAARRHANEAERLLGQEPLTLLLKAQAAQVSGNRAAAEAAFSRMMDDDGYAGARPARSLRRGAPSWGCRRGDAIRDRGGAARAVRDLGQRRGAGSPLRRAGLARRTRGGGASRPPSASSTRRLRSVSVRCSTRPTPSTGSSATGRAPCRAPKTP